MRQMEKTEYSRVAGQLKTERIEERDEIMCKGMKREGRVASGIANKSANRELIPLRRDDSERFVRE